MKALKARSSTLKQYISDSTIRLSDADRALFSDISRVRIVDESDAGVHYSGRKTPASSRLDRLVEAGILKRVDVYQPGRGNFKAYQFANEDVARVMGGKLPTIGAKRNALHEVITSRIYFAAGRPDSFTLEADFSRDEKAFFSTRSVDGGSVLPDAVYYKNGEMVVCEADSGQYSSSQIASKQAGWTGLKQVWGQPSQSAARVHNAQVYRFG